MATSLVWQYFLPNFTSFDIFVKTKLWLLTKYLDDTKSFYQLIITITLSKKTKLLHSSFTVCCRFYRVIGCCYGYCEKFCDWWIKRSALNMICWILPTVYCFSLIVTSVINMTVISIHPKQTAWKFLKSSLMRKFIRIVTWLFFTCK